MSAQVDNETSDWKYLLALRTLAIGLGIRPAFFVKTGWPAPAAGYPVQYPMLPPPAHSSPAAAEARRPVGPRMPGCVGRLGP